MRLLSALLFFAIVNPAVEGQCSVPSTIEPLVYGAERRRLTSGASFPVGTVLADFQCSECFHARMGSSSTTCLFTGRWSSNFPACLPMPIRLCRCDEPIPDYLVAKPANWSRKCPEPGALISYFECKQPGFRPSSSNVSNCDCQSDGRWNPPLPTCLREEPRCRVPSTDPRYGNITAAGGVVLLPGLSYPPGTILTDLQCDSCETPVLSGSTTLRCLPNGQWNDSFPQCQPGPTGSCREWPGFCQVPSHLVSKPAIWPGKCQPRAAVKTFGCAQAGFLPTTTNISMCGCDTGGRWEPPLPTCQRRIINCANFEWQCRDGHCVSLLNRCDGQSECRDGSDEEGCHQNDCGPIGFKCDNGQCVYRDWRCDGYDNCGDLSDESQCTSCEPSGYRCTDGSCITGDKFCDGRNDCSDGSDETQCVTKKCPPNFFKCNNGRCIYSENMCDGTRNCRDGSDELHCESRPCDSGLFWCDDTQLCQNAADRSCADDDRCPNGGLKALNCSLDWCSSFGHRRCHNTGRCIEHDKLCNGADDCGDGGSDEKGCRSFDCAPGTVFSGANETCQRSSSSERPSGDMATDLFDLAAISCTNLAVLQQICTANFTSPSTIGTNQLLIQLIQKVACDRVVDLYKNFKASGLDCRVFDRNVSAVQRSNQPSNSRLDLFLADCNENVKFVLAYTLFFTVTSLENSSKLLTEFDALCPMRGSPPIRSWAQQVVFRNPTLPSTAVDLVEAIANAILDVQCNGNSVNWQTVSSRAILSCSALQSGQSSVGKRRRRQVPFNCGSKEWQKGVLLGLFIGCGWSPFGLGSMSACCKVHDDCYDCKRGRINCDIGLCGCSMVSAAQEMLTGTSPQRAVCIGIPNFMCGEAMGAHDFFETAYNEVDEEQASKDPKCQTTTSGPTTTVPPTTVSTTTMSTQSTTSTPKPPPATSITRKPYTTCICMNTPNNQVGCNCGYDTGDWIYMGVTYGSALGFMSGLNFLDCISNCSDECGFEDICGRG